MKKAQGGGKKGKERKSERRTITQGLADPTDEVPRRVCDALDGFPQGVGGA